MQFEVYRRMTPQQRLLQAAKLYWAARALRTAMERANHPDWTDKQIHDRVKQVFLHART